MQSELNVVTRTTISVSSGYITCTNSKNKNITHLIA